MNQNDLLWAINSVVESGPCETLGHWSSAKALLAIIKMHRPITHTFPTGVQEIYCSCNGELIDEPYPCQTIQIIEEELAND